MPGKYTLGKNERLKSRKAIENLFQSGRRFNTGPYKVLWQVQKKPGLIAGTAVSSRQFKKAVDRNRVKRLTREAWRLQKLPLQQQLAGLDKGLHVFLIYTSGVLPVFMKVSESMSEIINRLQKSLHENPAANP